MIRAATFAIALIAFPQPSLAQQQAAISIELNGVEQLDGLCRFVFVNRNNTDDTVDALVMETVASMRRAAFHGLPRSTLRICPPDRRGCVSSICLIWTAPMCPPCW